MGLAPGSATANSFWTRARDKRLAVEWSKGRSAAEIAKTIGATRNAVIGRSMRLRGSVHPSDIASWTRANAQRSAALRKRAQSQRQAIRDMAKAMARGTPRGKAMSSAHRAGATWVQIGEHFGMSAQVAYQAGKAWAQRAQRAKAMRERAKARADLLRKVLREMTRAVARGMPQGQAVARAQRAGATFARIARQLGIAPQTAHYRAKIWTEQARPVRAFHRRQR